MSQADYSRMGFNYAVLKYKLTCEMLVRYPLPFDCIITPRTANVEGLVRDSLEMD